MTESGRYNCELYKKTANKYDKDRFSSKIGQWVDSCQKCIIRSLLMDITRKRVLEIGSGTGRITELLVQLGGNVTAMEPAEAMIEVARNRFVEKQLQQPKFVLGAIENYNSNSESYDFIVSVNVFGHLLDPFLFFEKCRALLSPQGKILFNFPSLRSPYILGGFMVNARKRALQYKVYSHWYWPSTIEKILNKTGFKILNQAGHLYLPINRCFFVLPIVQTLNTVVSISKGWFAPSVFIFAECK